MGNNRHILIFHDGWMLTKKKCVFFHYLPLIILLLYCLIFYIIVYFFPSCENIYFTFDMICIYPCFTSDYQLYMWKIIAHQLLPVSTIVFFSMILLLRVLCQKYGMHWSIQWRRHRKMTIQVLSISSKISAIFDAVLLIYWSRFKGKGKNCRFGISTSSSIFCKSFIQS